MSAQYELTGLQEAHHHVLNQALAIQEKVEAGHLTVIMEHVDLQSRLQGRSEDVREHAKSALEFVGRLLFKNGPVPVSELNPLPRQESLILSAEQMGRCQSALELYARLGMGQLDYLLENWKLTSRMMDSHLNRDQLAAPLEAVKRNIFDLSPNASHGIHNERIDDSNRVAWDLQQVMRNRMSWDRAGNPPARDWSTMFATHYDEPMRSSKQTPLVRVQTLPEAEAETAFKM